MSTLKKEKVLVFPGEEDMIVRTRPPYRYIRNMQDKLAVDGVVGVRPVITKDGITDGGSGEGIYDPAVIDDYNYPDWNSLSCPDIMTELGKLDEWHKTNMANGMISLLQSKKAFYQINLANSIYQQKCNITPVTLPPNPFKPSTGAVISTPAAIQQICVAGINVSGTPTTVSATVQMGQGATGFNYTITGSTGYSKTGEVTGNQLTLTDTFPAGSYTLAATAIIPGQTCQPLSQTFTIEAATGNKDVVSIPVIPVLSSVANTAMRSGGGGGGGGGGGSSSSTASKTSATTVKQKANYWWLLLIAAAGTTYYIYKKNKKKK